MNCQKLQNHFDDRLDGRLNETAARDFDAHVAGCVGCRQQWEQYQALWAVVARQSTIAPSFGFATRTLRRLHETPAQVRTWFWQTTIFRWATVGSLAIIVGLTSLLGWRHAEARRAAEIYAAAHQDRLDDLDVINALDKLEGDSSL